MRILPLGPPKSSLASDEGGAAAIEFAVLAPVLVLACLATIDLGLAFNQRMTIDAMVRAGVEPALADPGVDKVRDIVKGAAGDGITLTTDSADSFEMGGSSLSVDVTRSCACPESMSTSVSLYRRNMRGIGRAVPLLSDIGGKVLRPDHCSALSAARRHPGASEMMTNGACARAALRGFRRDEGGAGAVEFALVGSALILLVLGILWFGWVLQIRNDLAQAADRGVRYVVMNPTATDQAIQTEVAALLTGYSTSNLTVQADSQVVGATSFRRIRVSYIMPVSIPGVTSPVTLKVSRRTPTF